mmetsp:Transcript_55083/g.175209  ORF Transcript_55083/g.175209 Transcript_55083/m.175209 type:complete len:283 (-) Transcript_55083:599-1447(-)
MRPTARRPRGPALSSRPSMPPRASTASRTSSAPAASSRGSSTAATPACRPWWPRPRPTRASWTSAASPRARGPLPRLEAPTGTARSWRRCLRSSLLRPTARRSKSSRWPTLCGRWPPRATTTRPWSSLSPSLRAAATPSGTAPRSSRSCCGGLRCSTTTRGTTSSTPSPGGGRCAATPAAPRPQGCRSLPTSSSATAPGRWRCWEPRSLSGRASRSSGGRSSPAGRAPSAPTPCTCCRCTRSPCPSRSRPATRRSSSPPPRPRPWWRPRRRRGRRRSPWGRG